MGLWNRILNATKQEDPIRYPVNNRVSIWVGTHSSIDDLEDDAQGALTKKLGLMKHVFDVSELEHSPEPKEIRSMLDGFSGWQTFIDDACASANRMELPAATSAVVCYYLENNEAPGVRTGGLTFLGTFDGCDVTTKG
jgi:hypothetical protein